MTASELISTFRQSASSDTLTDLTQYFAYKPELKDDGYPFDTNLEFRTEVVEALLYDFSLSDIKLIRKLFDEEMKCELATRLHDNLYQLCFYLYDLGQLEDTFILYDAKFNAPNMDVGAMLNREAMTVGHEIEEVIDYVESEFSKHPELKEKYPTILDELNVLLEYPNYDNIKDYGQSIRAYFIKPKKAMKTDNEIITVTEQETIPIENNANIKIEKPWWKFW